MAGGGRHPRRRHGAGPADYADLLAGAGAATDAWETTYLHRLTGPDPVLQWISSTALRPVRDALDADAYAAFRAELAPRLRAAYPPRPDGTTWFPFRRIFAVARVPVGGHAGSCIVCERTATQDTTCVSVR